MSTENTSFRFTAEEETPYLPHRTHRRAGRSRQRTAARHRRRTRHRNHQLRSHPHDERRSRQVRYRSRRKRRRPQGPRRSTQAHHRAGILVTAAAPEIGSQHAAPLRDGMRTLQLAFREASPSRTSPATGESSPTGVLNRTRSIHSEAPSPSR